MRLCSLEMGRSCGGRIDRPFGRALRSAQPNIGGMTMRLAIQLLLGMALLPAAFATAARAEGAAAPIHIATYVEVAAASVKDGVAALTQYRDASRKENGNMRAEVAREIGRANRFVVLESWKDQAAFDAHGKSAATAAFRDKLKTIHNG